MTTSSILASMGAAAVVLLTLIIICAPPHVCQEVEALVTRAGMAALLVMAQLITATIIC